MNPSQKASLPAGLELPVLTDIVDEPTLPVLTEEPLFELPDFDFSSELDEMASVLPADAGAIELEIPAELPLEDVLDIGPAPRQVEPVVDFSRLPSLDLEVAALDELALDEVLPGLTGNMPAPTVQASPSGIGLKDEPFEFVLSPSDAAAAPVAGGPSEVAQLQDAGFDIPELTMEWSEEPVVSIEAEGSEAALPQSVELQSTDLAGAQDGGFTIPELNMEWVASPVAAEVEEGVVASPQPVELPSPAIEIPSLAGDDTVQVGTCAVVAEPWSGAVSTLDTVLADELAEPAASPLPEAPHVESETAATPFGMLAESDGTVGGEAEEDARPVPAMQRIDIESLPAGVLGGGVGPEPEAGGIHDQLPWGRTEYGSDADESPEAVAAALSELAALLEPASEVIQPEPAVLAVSESGAGEELLVTEVPSLASGADAVGVAEETTLSGEPDDGGEPAQPEGMTVGPGFLSPAAIVEQAAPVHAESAVESEGIQGRMTSEAPMLAEEAGSTEAVPLEPLGMANDEVGVVGVGNASDSGKSEAAALDYATSGLDEMHAFSRIEPVEVEEPLLQSSAAEESGEVAVAAAQLETVASNGLPEPSLASATSAAAEGMPEEAKARSCAVVDEQALIDSLTQKILPRMKVELSLWLQDALEMQARQMLSGVMHQLKEDYEMLFNETLRESLRQAISEIGRDEREGKS